MTALNQFLSAYRPELEAYLQNVMNHPVLNDYPEMRSMLRYHMGWEGEGAGPEAQGKRIRPMLLLLTTQAAGGDWRLALPAAAGAELLHNFSLIHDDIEDRSPLRRGRPTVWARWGEAQAINAGDALFTLSFIAFANLRRFVPTDTFFCAQELFYETCLRLTGGQHLDIAYEQFETLSFEAYWMMIAGKTAALIAACTGLGALIAGVGEERFQTLKAFGYTLGLCFQVIDDYLGIWGYEVETGKSTESDLVTGKKTLPVLYGLARNGRFAQRWHQGGIRSEEVKQLADWLVEEGAEEYTRAEADRLTREALELLERSQCEGEAGLALRELTYKLLERRQ